MSLTFEGQPGWKQIAILEKIGPVFWKSDQKL